MEQKRDTAKTEVSILLDTIIAHGVREVVASPGSRNAPLLLASSAREELKLTMVVDERTAAFVALGKSIVSQKPVMIICTSGTAPLNYAPALAEAFYAGVPIIAVTADRPKEWIDQDDSQTIRQDNIFSNFVKRSYDILTGRNDSNFLWYVNRVANEGMLAALSGKPGPIHFNIRLDNPLNNTTLRATKPPRLIKEIVSSPFLSQQQIAELATISKDKKILIVAGYGFPNMRLNKAVNRLAALPNVAVMAETISNLHLDQHSYLIDSVLTHLNEEEKKELRPDIVISLGGALVSRMLKEWLRKYPPAEHWDLSMVATMADCFQCLTRVIKTEAHSFLHQLASALRKNQHGSIPEYSFLWQTARDKANSLNKRYIAGSRWSDLKAFELIFRQLPEKVNLFLSNGTSIRYGQIISHTPPHATYCNRGVSGIDGCSSTAVGASTAYAGTTLLITGDMSFAYDIGAFGCRIADERMRIIVISNGGGGIFRFIKSTRDLTMLEECFCADPHPPVKGLAEAYGWQYMKASSAAELESALPSFFLPSSAPVILEIETPGEESAEILCNFFH